MELQMARSIVMGKEIVEHVKMVTHLAFQEDVILVLKVTFHFLVQKPDEIAPNNTPIKGALT